MPETETPPEDAVVSPEDAGEQPARPDGFQLIKGGTVIAYVDGKRYRLRRPRHGEYKGLYLLARERDDELTDLRQEAAAATEFAGGTLEAKVLAEVRAVVESVKVDGAPLDDETKMRLLAAAESKAPEPDRETSARLLREARQWGRRIGDRQTELALEWMRTVFNGDGDKIGALADSPLPGDVDEWPPWLGRPEYAGQLINHWGADPLAPGPQ